MINNTSPTTKKISTHGLSCGEIKIIQMGTSEGFLLEVAIAMELATIICVGRVSKADREEGKVYIK